MNSKIIRELLRKYAGTILLLLFVAIAAVLINVIAIEIGRRIINLISSSVSAAGGKERQLAIYCLGLLTAAVVWGAVDYGLIVMYSRFNQAFVRDIRLRLFNHLLRLPQDFFNKNPIGQITNRIMNEVGNIGSFFARLFLQPVIHMVMVIFYGVYLFELNWKLAIAGTVFIPFCVVIIPRFYKRIHRLTEDGIDSSGNLTGYFQEVFTGINDIRAGQTYFFEESRLKKKIREFVGINLNMAKTAGGLESLIMTITRFAPLTLYFYGGILCLRGEMAVGTLVASIVVVNSLYDPVNSIVNFIMEWRQASVRFEKLDEYLRFESESGIFPPDDRKEEAVSAGDIRFDKVRFGFSTDQILLSDINFFTRSGRKVAFVGTSGSGKSLTATLLGMIYKPLSGSITIGGRATDSIPLYDLRTKVGSVNQTLFLFNDTIRNNIIYGLLRKPGGGDNVETWVDFSLLDNINGTEMLDQRVLDIVRDVGLFEDVMNIGLRSKPGPGAGAISESDKTKIVAAREELAREISHYDNEYVEFYNEGAFLEYCTVFENIVFCPSIAIDGKFGSVKRFCEEHLYGQLEAKGLLGSLFAAGLKLARADNLLLGELYKDKSPLLSCVELDPIQIENRIKINEKLTAGIDEQTRTEDVDPSLVEDVVDLALNYCPGRSKVDVLDDKMRNEILGLRKDIKKLLSGKPGSDIASYDQKSFNSSLSFMENIIFGIVNPLRKKANEDISTLARKLLGTAGLEGLVIKRGLEFRVGERGARLSGGQKQKIVIARILLRNPSILVLDEATAALDAASQARIHDLIAEKYKDKTVISIAHRLNAIKDYDEILVFDRGRIVEQGTFEDLVNMDGLFRKLYDGSN